MGTAILPCVFVRTGPGLPGIPCFHAVFPVLHGAGSSKERSHSKNPWNSRTEHNKEHGLISLAFQLFLPKIKVPKKTSRSLRPWPENTIRKLPHISDGSQRFKSWNLDILMSQHMYFYPSGITGTNCRVVPWVIVDETFNFHFTPVFLSQ